MVPAQLPAGASLVAFFSGRSVRTSELLARVRDMTIRGAHPFAAAQLSPPPSRYAEGTVPEHNLANVRRIPGNAAKVYGLRLGK